MLRTPNIFYGRVWVLENKTYRLTHKQKDAKTIVTTDGYTFELPPWIEETSQVLAKHDDGFELFSMAVPFTSHQVRDSIQRLRTGGAPDLVVDDFRVVDFLGCKISGNTRYVELTVDDWLQVIAFRDEHCLEKELGKVVTRNNTAYRGDVPMFTWNTDGSYLVHKYVPPKVLTAVEELGVPFKIKYNSDNIHKLRCGVPYILGSCDYLPFVYGKGLHVSKVDNFWEFVMTDQHQEIRIHGESRLKKPDENRHSCFGWMFRQRYIRKRDGKCMLRSGRRIPSELQWMTLDMEVHDNATDRPDFFGTVVCENLERALKHYPNARCYRMSSPYIGVWHLDQLGRATVDIGVKHINVRRYY